MSISVACAMVHPPIGYANSARIFSQDPVKEKTFVHLLCRAPLSKWSKIENIHF